MPLCMSNSAIPCLMLQDRARFGMCCGWLEASCDLHAWTSLNSTGGSAYCISNVLKNIAKNWPEHM